MANILIATISFGAPTPNNVWPAPSASDFIESAKWSVCSDVSGLESKPRAKMEIRASRCVANQMEKAEKPKNKPQMTDKAQSERFRKTARGLSVTRAKRHSCAPLRSFHLSVGLLQTSSSGFKKFARQKKAIFPNRENIIATVRTCGGGYSLASFACARARNRGMSSSSTSSGGGFRSRWNGFIPDKLTNLASVENDATRLRRPFAPRTQTFGVSPMRSP